MTDNTKEILELILTQSLERYLEMKSNAAYVDRFVDWLRNQHIPGQIYGWPDCIVDWNKIVKEGGCISRKTDDENEELSQTC